MRCAVVLIGLLAASPAPAENRAGLHRVQAPGHAPLDCQCRAGGRFYAIGETACLRTAEGSRVAECRMVTNVTSWRMTGKPCPQM